MWSLPLTHGHRAETIFASGTARDERAERERAARRKRRGRAECATFSLHTPQRCLVCQWLTKCTIYAHMHARERCLHDTDIYIYIYTKWTGRFREQSWPEPTHSFEGRFFFFLFFFDYLFIIHLSMTTIFLIADDYSFSWERSNHSFFPSFFFLFSEFLRSYRW